MTYETVHTLRELVGDSAKMYQDHPFLRYVKDDQIQSETFAEFQTQAYAIASWVVEVTENLGHKPRIAMMSANSPLYVKMLMGVICGGGTAVLMDPQASLDVLCGCMNKAEVDLLILDPQIRMDLSKIRERCEKLTDILYMAEGERPNCGSILETYAGRNETPDIKPEDCAAILFTSGTTGEEKGVMLSHANLVDSVFNTNHAKGSIKLNILPMHHAFCLNADILLSFPNCSTLCMNGDSSRLGENLKLFEPTMLNMVPMVAQALYNKLTVLSQQTGKSEQDLKAAVFGSRIQKIVAGGAHLPSELVGKYQALGIFLCQGYGMTECSPTISSPDMNRPDKAHTAGHVVKRCVTRVVDGELQVKSPSVMMGYVNAPELTRQIITEDGWLCTGDIGYEDEDGFIHITGRKKSLIILSNGANVSPEQIENLLLDHQLIKEALVYGEGNTIVAEIYPDSQYAALHNIRSIPEEIGAIVQNMNAELPSYKRVMKHLIRTVPFQRTGSNKIIRSQRADRDMVLNPDVISNRKPENETQQMIFDCVAQILGHRDFGVDTDLFTAGLDSLGCIMLLSSFSEDLKFTLELDEFMALATVEKLANRYLEKSHWDAVDHSVRPVYGMSGVQTLFAYVMRGNTTSNIPFLFKLDPSVDLDRMKRAIEGLFPIHPILNDVVQMFQDKGYANFRDDNRPVNIPIIELSPDSWEQTMKGLIRPYLYNSGEPLYHIELYRVGEDKYLFFDLAHIISDGMTMSILLEDLNRLYLGETLEPETYTYYDFLIDHEHRMKMGLHIPNIVYYCKLMGDKRIKRSILNLSGTQDLSSHINAALHGCFRRVDEARVKEFCQANNISENVFFLTAFNYLISIYSDNSDTICSSIHNGRTDSRWGRIAGCLFATYGFRRKFMDSETVVDAVRNSARQILETMRCYLKNPHPDEMFFQYQGTLLNHNSLGGVPAECIPLQLDSLPFHMMVMNTRDGYQYELRFWENRMDRKQLEMFLEAMDAVLEAMLTETNLTDLRKALPGHLFPAAGTPGVLDRNGHLQPIGGWGTLMLDGKARTARILPDGTVDYLEDSGRCVMLSTMIGRVFPNLQKIEEVLTAYPGVEAAEAFTCYWQDNNMNLCADIACTEELDKDALRAYLAEKLQTWMIPQHFFKNGTLWN